MLILQPAEWAKPRGFSHGVAVDGPGRWVVLAGQTGGDEKGDYQPDMAGQVASALQRIIKLLGEAGAGPEHIVRLTWYLTSRTKFFDLMKSISYLVFSAAYLTRATFVATICRTQVEMAR